MTGPVTPDPRTPAAAARGALVAGMQPTLDRLRAIVSASALAAIGEGPVHPDEQLLALCAEALEVLLQENRAVQKVSVEEVRYQRTPEERAEYQAVLAAMRAARVKALGPLQEARKIKATTPAGIFAKALLVRTSITGASNLAMSLAVDLVECPALRAALWPAGVDWS